MSWAVDTPVRSGSYAFAAIVETKIAFRSGTGVMVAGGEKRPLLYLMLCDDLVSGVDPKGHFYAADEIELLYPQAIAQMDAQLGDTE